MCRKRPRGRRWSPSPGDVGTRSARSVAVGDLRHVPVSFAASRMVGFFCGNPQKSLSATRCRPGGTQQAGTGVGFAPAMGDIGGGESPVPSTGTGNGQPRPRSLNPALIPQSGSAQATAAPGTGGRGGGPFPETGAPHPKPSQLNESRLKSRDLVRFGEEKGYRGFTVTRTIEPLFRQ